MPLYLQVSQIRQMLKASSDACVHVGMSVHTVLLVPPGTQVRQLLSTARRHIGNVNRRLQARPDAHAHAGDSVRVADSWQSGRGMICCAVSMTWYRARGGSADGCCVPKPGADRAHQQSSGALSCVQEESRVGDMELWLFSRLVAAQHGRIAPRQRP